MLQRRIERLEKRMGDEDERVVFVIVYPDIDATDEEINAIADEARRARRVGVAIDQEVVDAYRQRRGVAQ